MWCRSPLIAGAVGALVLAGCGSENSALIPPEDADQLTTLVADAGDAVAAGECDAARDAVDEAKLRLNGLPRKTDKALKANLRDWLQHLDRRIAAECKPPEPEQTATPEPSETATETPEASPEPTAEPPEETPTTSPEPSVTVDPGTGGEETPEEQPGTGGVSPGDG